MELLVLSLLVAALVCFLLATFGVLIARVSVQALGLAIATIAAIILVWPGK